VKEETVQVNTEDERRRKAAEKLKTDVMTVDSDLFGKKNLDDQSPIGSDGVEESSFVQTGVLTTTTITTTTQSVSEKNVEQEPTKEWSQRIRDESDSTFQTRDGSDLALKSFDENNVISTGSTWSETFHERNIREEPVKEWYQRGRDKSGSAFHKEDEADSAFHSSTTEESWSSRSIRSTQRDTSTTFRGHERTGMTSPIPSPTLHGGMRCQAVDSKQLNFCSHEEKRRFYIQAVVDPRSGLHISVRQVKRDSNLYQLNMLVRNLKKLACEKQLRR